MSRAAVLTDVDVDVGGRLTVDMRGLHLQRAHLLYVQPTEIALTIVTQTTAIIVRERWLSIVTSVYVAGFRSYRRRQMFRGSVITVEIGPCRANAESTCCGTYFPNNRYIPSAQRDSRLKKGICSSSQRH